MTRDEREHLEGELGCAKSYADEMRSLADQLKKFAGNHGAIKDVYEDTAAALLDLADDFEFAKPFRDMRAELDDAEQADADKERGERIRAYQGSAL